MKKILTLAGLRGAGTPAERGRRVAEELQTTLGLAAAGVAYTFAQAVTESDLARARAALDALVGQLNLGVFPPEVEVVET